LAVNKLYRRLAFIVIIFLTVCGLFFVSLNILDIAENYRLDLPVAILNTIFISGVCLLVACIATKVFVATGAPEMFGLGSAVFSFCVGVLVYSWFTRAVLDVRIMVYDSAFFIAAVLHLCGAVFLRTRPDTAALKYKQKLWLIIFVYLVLCAAIGGIAWLLYRGVIPAIIINRDLSHGISAGLYSAAALLSFIHYRKTNIGYYYWYSLGLLLFVLGQLFIDQGEIASLVYWLGRISQYIAGFYILAAVFGALCTKNMLPSSSL
jgi:hypothetical protein